MDYILKWLSRQSKIVFRGIDLNVKDILFEIGATNE